MAELLSPAIKRDSKLVQERLKASSIHAARERDLLSFEASSSPVAAVLETVEAAATSPADKRLELKQAHKPPVLRADIQADEQVKAVASFFVNNARIDTKNFRQAEQLIQALYAEAQGNLSTKLKALAQELDKSTYKDSGYGKVLLKAKPSSIVFERLSPRHGKFSQELALDSETQSLVVLTKWHGSKRKVELLRGRRNRVNRNKAAFKFDAEVWKNYSHGPVSAASFQKLLDCAERNQHVLPKFVNFVNRKTIFNALLPDAMQAPQIRTNGKAISALNFSTNAAEKISIKLSPKVSCLQLIS